jgi:Zn-dependent peptidase ImmA (M78 family)/DNA-binding XRE family transcriptional regulator
MLHYYPKKKKINPTMVALARKTRGYSRRALAAQMGITISQITQIEQGITSLDYTIPHKIAEALDYPMSLFFQEIASYRASSSERHHCMLAETSKRLAEQIQARIDLRLHQLERFLLSVDIPCSVPQFPVEEFQNDPTLIAELLRAQWKLPRGPIQDLVDTLEDAGIMVVLVDFETMSIDAMSRWVPGLPPLILANKNIPKDRLRFSLAHELGHLVMHDRMNPHIEEQANAFAAEFLMPARDIQLDLQRIDIHKLCALKQYWRVSIASLIGRAATLQTITPNQHRYMRAAMAKNGYKQKEPVEFHDGEEPSLLKDLVETFLKDLKYSVSTLQEMVSLNQDEFWETYLTGLDQPPLKVVEKTPLMLVNRRR